MSGPDVAPALAGQDPSQTLEELAPTMDELVSGELLAEASHSLPGVQAAESSQSHEYHVEQRPVGQRPRSVEDDDEGFDLELFVTIAVGIATGLVLTILAWYFDFF